VAQKSEVAETWDRLSESLITLIDSSHAYMESQRPPKEPRNPGYALECFIMGSSEVDATPCVCVISEAEWLRKAICKRVRKSRLLDAHGFSCRTMPGDPRPCTNFYYRPWLDTDELERFGFDILSRSEKAKGGVQIETFPDSDYFDADDGRATIGGMVEINGQLYGLTVRHAFLMAQSIDKDMDSTIPRDSSKGATDFDANLKFDFDSDFEDDDDDYDDPEWVLWNTSRDDAYALITREDLKLAGLAVDEDENLEGFIEGDGFMKSEDTEAFAEDEDMNDRDGFLENEGASEVDANSYSHQHTRGSGTTDPIDDTTLGGNNNSSGSRLKPSKTKRTEAGPSPSSATTSTRTKRSLFEHAQRLPPYAAFICVKSRLDWALAKVGLSLETSPRKAIPVSDMRVGSVWVHTPTTVLEGYLKSQGIFGVHNVLPPQRVLLCSMPDRIPMAGESGSWAFDTWGTFRDEFVGMLIGCCPSRRKMYILPAPALRDDIAQQLGLDRGSISFFAFLPSSTETSKE
jgi:hypothetical protein